MNRFKSELTLGAVLLALFFAISYWQAPGHVLTKAEIDQYLTQIDKLAPMPAEEKAQFLADMRAWGEADDGKPIYMFNLMRYHAQIKPQPGIDFKGGTPDQVNRQYEAMTVPLALPLGVQMPVASNAVGVRKGANPSSNLIGHEAAADNWDRMLVVRYPSREAFFKLVSNGDYLTKMMPYKFAALHVDLVPTDGEAISTDLRVLAGFIFLAVFLAFGWFRAARRR